METLSMRLEIIAHIMYLLISFGLTLWVARRLFSNGRLFLIDAFGGDKAMGDSVNNLLLVGFYLLNLGFVALFLSSGRAYFDNWLAVLENVTWRVGVVMLVLGVMHFANLFNFGRIRSKSRRAESREEFLTREEPVAG